MGQGNLFRVAYLTADRKTLVVSFKSVSRTGLLWIQAVIGANEPLSIRRYNNASDVSLGAAHFREVFLLDARRLFLLNMASKLSRYALLGGKLTLGDAAWAIL
jgi:hypothetical protein